MEKAKINKRRQEGIGKQRQRKVQEIMESIGKKEERRKKT